jgi:hypothetical protein
MVRISRILQRHKYRRRYGPVVLERLQRLETIDGGRTTKTSRPSWPSLAVDNAVTIMFLPTITALKIAEGLLSAKSCG